MNKYGKFYFGKYKNKSIDLIAKTDPNYIIWLKNDAKISGELKLIIDSLYEECVALVESQKSLKEMQLFSGSKVYFINRAYGKIESGIIQEIDDFRVKILVEDGKGEDIIPISDVVLK